VTVCRMSVFRSQFFIIVVMNVAHCNRSLLADVQMSDWLEVQCAMTDDWKSMSIVVGEQSVMMISTM